MLVTVKICLTENRPSCERPESNLGLGLELGIELELELGLELWLGSGIATV
jgi:hypothetical protein